MCLHKHSFAVSRKFTVPLSSAFSNCLYSQNTSQTCYIYGSFARRQGRYMWIAKSQMFCQGPSCFMRWIDTPWKYHHSLNGGQLLQTRICSPSIYPASILYKSTVGRYRPVSYPDGPITAHCRFIKNGYWVHSFKNGGFLQAFWLAFFTDRADVFHLRVAHTPSTSKRRSKYSNTSMNRTPMARLSWLIWTRFLGPRKFAW